MVKDAASSAIEFGKFEWPIYSCAKVSIEPNSNIKPEIIKALHHWHNEREKLEHKQ